MRKAKWIIYLTLICWVVLGTATAWAANATWTTNQVLGPNGSYPYAGIYQYDNLTIGDNVEVTSKGISHLVIKVNGTLTLGKNATIRVRNGYYAAAPTSLISNLTASNLNTTGVDGGGFRVYPNMFGKGGNGGAGGPNVSFYSSGAGGGGGGGYGGGTGGSGGIPASSGAQYGVKGSDNGGAGGNGGRENYYSTTVGGAGGSGGSAQGLGGNGAQGLRWDNDRLGDGSGGGGGNSGNGADRIVTYYSGYESSGGAGGGGGGYGGGVLTIIANNIVFDSGNLPRFIVSGQKGGNGGSGGGTAGENGAGGLLIIQCPTFPYKQSIESSWNLAQGTYGTHNVSTTNGGHGIVTGGPQKVFINSQEPVSVTGINIPQPGITLVIGKDPGTITSQVLPSNATNKNIIWTSSNTSVATVDTAGVVTAGAPGTAIITAATQDGGFTATCSVTVGWPVTGVTLDQSALTLKKGSTPVSLTATVAPSNAVIKNVTWSSSNTAVAEVDANGRVTPKAQGTATITATTVDGGFQAQCQVTVYIPVTFIYLNKTELALTMGKGSSTLTATVTPADATNKKVIWSSSASNIASVDQTGKVSSVALGSAVITARTEDGNLTAQCNVTVGSPASGITLDKTQLVLGKGGAGVQLQPSVAPTTATDKRVTWSSSNPTAVSVTNGLVTPLDYGTARITAKTVDGGFEAYCDVLVVRPVTGVSLDKKTCALVVGRDTAQLTATVSPADAYNKNITWTSSNDQVAKVSSSGLVTPISSGTALITVTTEDGGFADTCTVTVGTPVTGITLDKSLIMLRAGEKEIIIPAVAPATAANKRVIWTSRNPNIALVKENGEVEGVAQGVTEILAVTEDNGFSALCRVHVTAREVLSVTPKAGDKDVSVNQVINILFSEEMDASTANGTTLRMRKDSDLVPGSVKYIKESKTAVFTPAEPLDYKSTYTVFLSYRIRTAQGTPLGGSNENDLTWSFTTEKEDIPGPADTPWPQHLKDPARSAQSCGIITDSSRLRWKVPTGQRSAAPAVGDKTIYCPGDKALIALSPDGTVKWTFPLLGQVNSTPALAGNGTVYFTAGTVLYAIKDQGTWAAPLWSYDFTNNTRVLPHLLDWEGKIYLSTSLEAVNVLGEITYLSELFCIEKGELVWKKNYDKEIVSGPVMDSAGVIYQAAGNKIHAVARNGKSLWQAESGDGGRILSLTVGKGDNIYAAAEGGMILAFDRGGLLVWAQQLEGTPTPPAAGNDEEIFVGDSTGELYRLDQEGEIIRRFNVGSVLTAPPVLDKANNIVIGAVSGWVYSFEEDGTQRWMMKTGSQVTAPAVIGGGGTVYVKCVNGYLYALGGAVVELVMEKNKVLTNKNVTCAVNISGVADLSASDIKILFDSSVAEVAQIIPGSFFDGALSVLPGPREGTVLGSSFAYNNCEGWIVLSGSKKWGESLNGDVTLADIVFTSKSSGMTPVIIGEQALADKYSRSISALSVDTGLEVALGGTVTGTLKPEGVSDPLNFEIILEDGNKKKLVAARPLADFRFVFPDLEPGSYKISVYGPVYLRERLDISLGAGAANMDTGLILMRTGDIDKNNKIDLMDLTIFAKTYGTKPGNDKWRQDADFNRDARISILDLTYLARNYDLIGANASVEQ